MVIKCKKSSWLPGADFPGLLSSSKSSILTQCIECSSLLEGTRASSSVPKKLSAKSVQLQSESKECSESALRSTSRLSKWGSDNEESGIGGGRIWCLIVFGVTYLAAAVCAVFGLGVYRPSKIFLAVTEVGDEVTLVEDSAISVSYFFEIFFFFEADLFAFFFGWDIHSSGYFSTNSASRFL